MAVASIADDSLRSADVGQFGLVWQRFRKHRLALIGIGVFATITLLSLVVPMLSPFTADARDGSMYLKPMGAVHPYSGKISYLGTDALGRDFMTQLFVGTRMTLLVALVPTLVVVVIGTLLGGLAGYFGGWVDTAIMRVTDFVAVLPLLPAYLFAFRIIKPARITEYAEDEIFAIVLTVMLVFVLFGWMGICRLVRSSMLTLRQMPFVEASKALGAGHSRLLFRHLLPNAIAPITVAATFAMGDFIIIEAVLTYFGLGLRNPPISSLGSLVSNAQSYAWTMGNLNPFEDIRPYLLFLPTLFILLTVLSINYIGDALREAADPHTRI